MFYLEALLIKKHLRVKWCKLSLVQCSIQLCELKKKVVPCAQTDRHDEENKKKGASYRRSVWNRDNTREV